VLLAGLRFDLTVKLSGTGAVRGRVTDGSGAPLAGIRVHGGQRWSGGFGQGEAEAVTGSDGSFRLDGLEVGQAVVWARRPGADSGASKALDVKEGEVATADLTLLDVGALEGTIVAPGGQPVTGRAYAVVGPDDSSWNAGGQVRVEADASGRFHVAVPAGQWHAFASRGRRTNGVYTPTGVAIEAGQVSRMELTLTDGAAAGQILVRFFEPGGAPSAGATAEVLLSPEARLLTMADERGELQVSAGASAEGDGPPILVSARNGGRQAVDVPVARTIQEASIQLQPGARLSGRVDGGSQPVTGFTLTVEMPRRPFFSYAEAISRQFTGDRYALSDVPTGHATLLAVADDGRAGRTSLDLRSGEAAEAVIRLEAPGRIRARPVTTPGHPAPGAYLTLGSRMIDADPAGFYHRPGDGEGGLLEADGVAPGTVVIEVGARCFEPVRREVNVKPGETLDLGEVQLKAVPKSACGG
jgi:hypothetical protein